MSCDGCPIGPGCFGERAPWACKWAGPDAADSERESLRILSAAATADEPPAAVEPPAADATPRRPSIRLARLGARIGRDCLYRSPPDCSCQSINRCWMLDPAKGRDVGPLECLRCRGLWPPADADDGRA